MSTYITQMIIIIYCHILNKLQTMTHVCRFKFWQRYIVPIYLHITHFLPWELWGTWSRSACRIVECISHGIDLPRHCSFVTDQVVGHDQPIGLGHVGTVPSSHRLEIVDCPRYLPPVAWHSLPVGWRLLCPPTQVACRIGHNVHAGSCGDILLPG